MTDIFDHSELQRQNRKSSEKPKKQTADLSRRDFLKAAGILTGSEGQAP